MFQNQLLHLLQFLTFNKLNILFALKTFPRYLRRWAGLSAHTQNQDLRSYEIRKYQESVLTLQNDSLVPSLPAKMKILLILAKTSQKQQLNVSRSALFHMKNRVSLKYFVSDCLWKSFFHSNPFRLNFFNNFYNSNILHTVLNLNLE